MDRTIPRWLQDAFASAGDIEWRHLKIYEVMPDFPSSLEAMRAYDVIVLSDVGIEQPAAAAVVQATPRGAHG